MVEGGADEGGLRGGVSGIEEKGKRTHGKAFEAGGEDVVLERRQYLVRLIGLAGMRDIGWAGWGCRSRW